MKELLEKEKSENVDGVINWNKEKGKFKKQNMKNQKDIQKRKTMTHILVPGIFFSLIR